MKELKYGYQLQKGCIILMPLPGYSSVYIDLDEILAELKTKVPDLMRKHIICVGDDGYWDLILPAGKWGLRKTQIYPLNALTVAQAQVKIRELIATAKI
jgi:hypothetical protein